MRGDGDARPRRCAAAARDRARSRARCGIASRMYGPALRRRRRFPGYGFSTSTCVTCRASSGVGVHDPESGVDRTTTAQRVDSRACKRTDGDVLADPRLPLPRGRPVHDEDDARRDAVAVITTATREQLLRRRSRRSAGRSRSTASASRVVGVVPTSPITAPVAVCRHLGADHDGEVRRLPRRDRWATSSASCCCATAPTFRAHSDEFGRASARSQAQRPEDLQRLDGARWTRRSRRIARDIAGDRRATSRARRGVAADRR